MNKEEAQVAKDDLQKALSTYYDKLRPGDIIIDWVLVVHINSVQLERENATIVGHLYPTGQTWPMTMGLLTAAGDAVRGTTNFREEPCGEECDHGNPG